MHLLHQIMYPRASGNIRDDFRTIPDFFCHMGSFCCPTNSGFCCLTNSYAGSHQEPLPVITFRTRACSSPIVWTWVVKDVCSGHWAYAGTPSCCYGQKQQVLLLLYISDSSHTFMQHRDIGTLPNFPQLYPNFPPIKNFPHCFNFFHIPPTSPHIFPTVPFYLSDSCHTQAPVLLQWESSPQCCSCEEILCDTRRFPECDTSFWLSEKHCGILTDITGHCTVHYKNDTQRYDTPRKTSPFPSRNQTNLLSL